MSNYRFEGVNQNGVTIGGRTDIGSMSDASLAELVENYFRRGWQSLTVTETEITISDGKVTRTEREVAGIGEKDGRHTWWVSDEASGGYVVTAEMDSGVTRD